MATTVVLSPLAIQQFFDAAGDPLAGGTLSIYQAGTLTPVTAYSEYTGTTTLPNPNTLNTRGEIATNVGASVPLYLPPNVAYKYVLKDSLGNVLWTEDNITPDKYILTATTVGQLLWPRTAAEIAAGVTPTYYYYEPGDVRRYGADYTGVADAGAAFNTAYNVAVALGNTIGGVIRAPAGSYNITTPVVFSSSTCGYLSLIGDGPATKIINNVIGAPANPCIKVSATAPYFLFQGFDIYGNNTTGGGGNGHGISIINPDGVGVAGVSTFYPQSVTVRSVAVQYHRGTGKDYAGAAIPSCGIYAYGVTVHNYDDFTSYTNACGWRGYLASKVKFNQSTIDGADVGVNGLYIDSCEDVRFLNGTLNGCGVGGATDGLVYMASTSTNIREVTIRDSRIKNGNPYCFNGTSATVIVQNLTIDSCSIRQLNDPGSHALTAIALGNAHKSVAITNNGFQFVSTITAAVGIDCQQTVAGNNMPGLSIDGNLFDAGNGATYLAAIRLNVTTNKVLAPRISRNTFGSPGAGPFTITDAIRLAGNVENPTLEGNVFIPQGASTITNAINLTNSGVKWPRLLNNSYITSAGAITNEVTIASAVDVSRIEGGVFSPGDAVTQVAIANNGTITTASQPLVRLAPAGNVNGIIMQAGTFRGQHCVVANNSAFTITMAVAGTSNVADGVTAVIATLTAMMFVWDANTSLWFRTT